MSKKIEYEVLTEKTRYRGFIREDNPKTRKNYENSTNLLTEVFGYRPTNTGKMIRTMIMGTIPSRGGFEQGFYYMGEKNAFYEILDKALGYKNKYQILKDKYVNSKTRDERREIIDKILESLENDHILLCDTLDSCLRINSMDSGIMQYKCHDISVFQRIFAECENIENIIFTSDGSRDYFKEIIGLKDSKMTGKNVMEKFNLKKKIKIIDLPSPSFRSTKNNKEKIKKVSDEYSRVIKVK